MRYRASNGITPTVELTEDEARTHWEAAAYRVGTFGGRFVVCPVGEYGRLLVCAATTYAPIPEVPGRRGRAHWWQLWRPKGPAT